MLNHGTHNVKFHIRGQCRRNDSSYFYWLNLSHILIIIIWLEVLECWDHLTLTTSNSFSIIIECYLIINWWSWPIQIILLSLPSLLIFIQLASLPTTSLFANKQCSKDHLKQGKVSHQDHLEPFLDRLHVLVLSSYDQAIRVSLGQDSIRVRECLDSWFQAYTNLYPNKNRKQKPKNFSKFNQ